MPVPHPPPGLFSGIALMALAYVVSIIVPVIIFIGIFGDNGGGFLIAFIGFSWLVIGNIILVGVTLKMMFAKSQGRKIAPLAFVGIWFAVSLVNRGWVAVNADERLVAREVPSSSMSPGTLILRDGVGKDQAFRLLDKNLVQRLVEITAGSNVRSYAAADMQDCDKPKEGLPPDVKYVRIDKRSRFGTNVLRSHCFRVEKISAVPDGLIISFDRPGKVGYFAQRQNGEERVVASWAWREGPVLSYFPLIAITFSATDLWAPAFSGPLQKVNIGAPFDADDMVRVAYGQNFKRPPFSPPSEPRTRRTGPGLMSLPYPNTRWKIVSTCLVW